MKSFSGMAMGAFIAASLLAVVACNREAARPLRFKVTFHDSQGLSAGQPVICLGQKVGTVEQVTLAPPDCVQVSVVVEPAFKKMAFHESVYEIAKPGGMLDRSDQRTLTITNPVFAQIPVKSGEVLEGKDSWLNIAGRKAKDIVDNLPEYAAHTCKAAAEFKDRLTSQWHDFANSPEGQDFLGALDNAAQRAAKLTADSIVEFRRDILPVLREKAACMCMKLEAAGRTKEAHEFWDQFQHELLDWQGARISQKHPLQDGTSTVTGD